MNKIKIGRFELFCILINYICSTVIRDYPRNMADSAGGAGWLLSLYITLIILVVFSYVLKLLQTFKNKDILDVAEFAIGKTGLVIFGILFIFQLVLLNSVILREFAEDIKVISLDHSPISFVIILFCITIVITAYSGIETVARLNMFFVPVMIVLYFSIIGASIPNVDISRIMPILGLGPKEVFINNLWSLSYFSEASVIFLLITFFDQRNDYRKTSLFTILVCGSFLTLGTLVYLLIYQYKTATENFLPLFQLARGISYGRVFTRIESAFILFWTTVAYLYLGTGIVLIIRVFSKVFSIKHQKPLVIPFVLLIFSISLIPENLYETTELETIIYKASGITMLLIPIVIILIGSFKRKVIYKNEKV